MIMRNTCSLRHRKLQAALRLCRLGRSQGRDHVDRLRRTVYDTFTESFATAGLTEARDPSVLPFPARKPRGDLLEQPAVAVRIAERGIREIGATFRVRARKKAPPVAVEHLADLDAAAGEVFTGCVDVGDDQLQTLSGAGLGCGEAVPECDRASRVRGRELDRPNVAESEVGIQPSSQALIEALGTIDVGDGQRHDLELHVYA